MWNSRAFGSNSCRAKQHDQLEDDDKAKSEDELRAEYRAIAERRVRLGLLLAKVGEDNEVQVTQEDLNKALIEQIRSYPGHEQAVMNVLSPEPEGHGRACVRRSSRTRWLTISWNLPR